MKITKATVTAINTAIRSHYGRLPIPYVGFWVADGESPNPNLLALPDENGLYDTVALRDMIRQTVPDGPEGLVLFDVYLYEHDGGLIGNVYVCFDATGVRFIGDYATRVRQTPLAIASAKRFRVYFAARTACKLKSSTPLPLVADWLEENSHEALAGELRSELSTHSTPETW